MGERESKNKKAPNSFLTIPEVQSFLGIKSRKTILKYIKSGKLPAYKIGGTRWRIAYDDVHSFLKKEFMIIADEAEKAPEKTEEKPAEKIIPGVVA